MHGGEWFSFIRYDEEQDRPKINRELLARVCGLALGSVSGSFTSFLCPAVPLSGEGCLPCSSLKLLNLLILS